MMIATMTETSPAHLHRPPVPQAMLTTEVARKVLGVSLLPLFHRSRTLRNHSRNLNHSLLKTSREKNKNASKKKNKSASKKKNRSASKKSKNSRRTEIMASVSDTVVKNALQRPMSDNPRLNPPRRRQQLLVLIFASNLENNRRRQWLNPTLDQDTRRSLLLRPQPPVLTFAASAKHRENNLRHRRRQWLNQILDQDTHRSRLPRLPVLTFDASARHRENSLLLHHPLWPLRSQEVQNTLPRRHRRRRLPLLAPIFAASAKRPVNNPLPLPHRPLHSPDQELAHRTPLRPR